MSTNTTKVTIDLHSLILSVFKLVDELPAILTVAQLRVVGDTSMTEHCRRILVTPRSI